METTTDTEAHGPSPAYTFGDTDAATIRLGLLAQVFAESTTTFLDEVVPTRPRRVVDLGCGPGHTTRLLARVLAADETVGLDNSDHFLDQAAAGGTDAGDGGHGRVRFARHDVTAVPFPVGGPVDVLYARFLLMHLPQPTEVLARWAGALAPGGVALVQESEAIATDVPAFQAYLDIVAAMLADNDNHIYLGPHLAAVAQAGELVQQESLVWRVDLPAEVASQMYRLNIRAWRDNDFIQRTVPQADLDALDAELEALATAPGVGGVAWDVRGLVFQRPR